MSEQLLRAIERAFRQTKLPNNRNHYVKNEAQTKQALIDPYFESTGLE